MLKAALHNASLLPVLPGIKITTTTKLFPPTAIILMQVCVCNYVLRRPLPTTSLSPKQGIN